MKESVNRPNGAALEEFRIEEFLPYRLSVASEGVARMITRDHLGKAGLGMPEWRLLAAVGRHGVISPTAAGEQTSMDKVKVSRAAASLVGRGLLKQTKDPEDGRGRLLRLTRKGNAVYLGLIPVAQQIEQNISSCLTMSEWTVLHKTLGKLMDHTQRHLTHEAAAAE